MVRWHASLTVAGSNQHLRRLEYLKTRRKHWEEIYNYVTKQDAAATLSMIEEANRKVLVLEPGTAAVVYLRPLRPLRSVLISGAPICGPPLIEHSCFNAQTLGGRHSP
jgi:hypothetical protein